MIAGIAGIPFIIITLGFPIYSIFALKNQLGGEIGFLDAFVHLLVLFMSANLGDLVVLDWLIISKLTPGFVVIPGSEVEDYKDFSHHYKGHVFASIILVIVSMVVALVVIRFP